MKGGVSSNDDSNRRDVSALYDLPLEKEMEDDEFEMCIVRKQKTYICT